MATCTIVCPEIDHEAFLEGLTEVGPGPPLVVGDHARWHSIELEFPSSRLRFTSLTEAEVRDKFDRTSLGLSNFFRIIQGGPERIREFLIHAALAAPWLIGVVADPGFSDDEGHFDCLFAMTAWLPALIFNGSGMLDPTGHLLLDAEGNSEADLDPNLEARFRAISG